MKVLSRFLGAVVLSLLSASLTFAQNRYFPAPYPQEDVVLEALDVYMEAGHATLQWPNLIVPQLRRNPVAGGPLDVDCALNAWSASVFTGAVDGWGYTAHSTPGGLNEAAGIPATPASDGSTIYWKSSLEITTWQYDYPLIQANDAFLEESTHYVEGSTANPTHDSLYCAVDFTNGYAVPNQGNAGASIVLEVWIPTAGWGQVNHTFDPIAALSVGMRAYYSDAILDHDWASNGEYLLRWHLYPDPGSVVPEYTRTFNVPRP